MRMYRNLALTLSSAAAARAPASVKPYLFANRYPQCSRVRALIQPALSGVRGHGGARHVAVRGAVHDAARLTPGPLALCVGRGC
jgi:hypothetical protein